MKSSQPQLPAPRLALGAPPPAYQQWVDALGQTGWISLGSVVRRHLRRRVAGRWVDKGPYYFWTCKVAGRTVCQALSQAQYEHLQGAIAANRQVLKTLARMRRTTLQTILKKVPGVRKRK